MYKVDGIIVEKDRSELSIRPIRLKMLPPLYQTHLEKKLEPSEFLFFNILIKILQDIREISLEKIA
jgi:hypothetical protein